MSKYIQEKGINDMPRGWITENKLNKIIYRKWSDMLRRVYDEEYHKRCPTYIDSSICIEWHWLSKFAEDFRLIDGYDEKELLSGKLELDKDIKSNGINKEYSLDNCTILNHVNNFKQALKTRENNYLRGEKNVNFSSNSPKSKKIIQYDKQMNVIKIWNCLKDVERELNIYATHISACCRGKQKAAGGYIWRYYEV